MSTRTFLWLLCAALLGLADQALALDPSKFTTNSRSTVVSKIEGRKGTRIYTPDTLEPTTTSHEQNSKEKIDECMASWDAKTHITKAAWRKICERQLSEGSL
jgi:hypothetical protein